MEECILDVKLMDRPVVGESQTENSADSGWLHNRTERLIKIHTRTLSKSTENPSSFIAVKSTIRVELVSKNPFTSHNIGMRRPWYQSPGVVGNQSLKLLLHSTTPIRISESTANRGWHR